MPIYRRAFIINSATTALLAGCSGDFRGNGFGGDGAARIDNDVDATLAVLSRNFPGTNQIRNKSRGVLVFPYVTEAGLGLGGAFGRGALRSNGMTLDYYSMIKGSAGLQIGGQQYAHVLFFMTDEALQSFRQSPGFAAGANVTYATPQQGATALAETTTALAPVIAVVFGQQGIRAGATLEGVKYTRVIP